MTRAEVRTQRWTMAPIIGPAWSRSCPWRRPSGPARRGAPRDAGDGRAGRDAPPRARSATPSIPTAAVLYVAIDDKPKRTADPHRLARVRDIVADPRVSVLVDRWDEDWSRLAWLRCEGRATLLEPGVERRPPSGRAAIAALRERYPAYAGHDLEARSLLRIEIASNERRGATSDASGADQPADGPVGIVERPEPDDPAARPGPSRRRRRRPAAPSTAAAGST